MPLGFKYIRFDATTYVIRYANGSVKREGRGLSFWYWAPSTSIAAIPMGSADVQFIFKEATADFQTVTIQGQATYKIEQPKQMAEMLDFTVDAQGHYKKDDHEKLAQRLTNDAQTATSAFVRSINLKEAITSAKAIEERIFEGLSKSESVLQLGIKPLSVNILAVKPTPEMERALEAQTREALQQEADQAVYDRRNFAVEQERRIQESELSTQIAVEEKNKQIAEKKMETELLQTENDRKLRDMRLETEIALKQKKLDADKQAELKRRELREEQLGTELALQAKRLAAQIAGEKERKALVEHEAENARVKAAADAFALAQRLAQYEQLDWKKIMAIEGGGSAKQHVAIAFRELAENANNIQNLNISPDLLQQMISGEEQAAE